MGGEASFGLREGLASAEGGVAGASLATPGFFGGGAAYVAASNSWLAMQPLAPTQKHFDIAPMVKVTGHQLDRATRNGDGSFTVGDRIYSAAEFRQADRAYTAYRHGFARRYEVWAQEGIARRFVAPSTPTRL